MAFLAECSEVLIIITPRHISFPVRCYMVLFMMNYKVFRRTTADTLSSVSFNNFLPFGFPFWMQDEALV